MKQFLPGKRNKDNLSQMILKTTPSNYRIQLYL